MAINKINNGDSGSIARAIINAVIDAVNGFGTTIADLKARVIGIEKSIGTNIFTEEDRTKLDNAVTSEQLTDALKGKVTAIPGSRLMTEQEADTLSNVATKEDLSAYVKTVAGQRLITDEEATKLDNAVEEKTLTDGLLKKVDIDTKDIPLIEKEYKNIVLYSRYEGEEGVAEPKQYKISLPNLINEIKTSGALYSTAKPLEGVKDGKNNIFTIKDSFIKGSEKININGAVYYPNIGFIHEGENIVLTSTPIPEAGDFIYLEAIFI